MDNISIEDNQVIINGKVMVNPKNLTQSEYEKRIKIADYLTILVKSSITVFSMFLFAFSFMLLLNISFLASFGFTLLILGHELGHYIQIRKEKLHPSFPIFIPLLGALISFKEMPKNALTDAKIGIAGPILGTIVCLIPLAIYLFTGSTDFAIMAYLGFLVNLFNLFPLTPLDGGRVLNAIIPILGYLFFIILLIYTIFNFHIIFTLILTFSFIELKKMYEKRQDGYYKEYYKTNWKSKLILLVIIFLIIITCVIGMGLTADAVSHIWNN